MVTTAKIDWSNVVEAAQSSAGNWRTFPCFAWHRGYDLGDADKWLIYYTSNRDSGLLEKSNESAILKLLDKYTEADDPNVVFETHNHFAVGHVDGLSLRVFRADGSVTDAFVAFCDIQVRLEDYPVLDEEEYSERELQATLENYGCEIGNIGKTLPAEWEGEVYQHFSNSGKDRFIENRDDQGGWAPREELIEALVELGLLKEDE